MQKVKIGDIFRFSYHDYLYTNKPIVVTNVTTSFVNFNVLENGIKRKDELSFPKFYVLKNGNRMNVKALGVKERQIDELLEEIAIHERINYTISLDYTPLKRCLRKDKFDILKLYFRKKAVYIHYDTVTFVRKRSGKLICIINGCRLCGRK